MVSFKSNLRKHNLAFSFILIIFIFTFFGYFSFHEITELGETAETIFSHPLVVSNAALNADLNVIQIHRSMKDVAISENTLEFELAVADVNRAEAEAYRHMDLIQEHILGIKGKNLERETRKLLDEWKPIRAEVIALTREDKTKEAISITKNKGAEHVVKLENKMKALNLYARDKAVGFMRNAVKTKQHLINLSIIGTISGIILCLIISLITIFRVNRYENDLKEDRDKLMDALDEINTLQGILPVCSYCRKVRDDEGAWSRLEEYIHINTDAKISHGICPNCLQENFPNEAEEILAEQQIKKS